VSEGWPSWLEPIRCQVLADESGMTDCDATVPQSRTAFPLARFNELRRAPLWLLKAIQPPDGDRGLPLLDVSLRRSRKRNLFGSIHETAAISGWEKPTPAAKLPGLPARQPVEAKPVSYRRPGRACALVIDGRRPGPHLRGLDLSGRQIEWSTTPTKSEKLRATWTSFEVDHNGREATKKSPLTVFLTPAAPTSIKLQTDRGGLTQSQTARPVAAR